MFINKTNLILILIILGLLSISCFSTSETIVQGYVRAGANEPIAGAKVTLGGVISPSETKTDEKGFYKITTRHSFTQMLYLKVEKEGYAEHSEKFPGFAAPSEDKNIELMKTIPRRRK